MLSTTEIEEILGTVQYRDWQFILGEDGDRAYLQVQFDAPDMTTGEPELQRGRKWFLSPHMTKSEIVTTSLKAVLTAVEHEAREDFKYKGKAIFGPHWDVDALHEQLTARNIDMRTGQWVKTQ